MHLIDPNKQDIGTNERKIHHIQKVIEIHELHTHFLTAKYTTVDKYT
jgi:hypothetical protein